jgi:hypothetical protein
MMGALSSDEARTAERGDKEKELRSEIEESIS